MTVDEIYLSIAKNIINSTDSGWDEAILNVERAADDAIKFKGGCSSGEDYTSFKFRNFDRRQLTKDFHQLHSITTENDSNQWNRAKFTLAPSGKFSIDFEWDQSLADEIESLS